MNSTLKTAIPIGLLVVVVSVLTLISQFTVKPPSPGGGADDDRAGGGPAGPPLEFNSQQVFYDPDSIIPANRAFPGFFEVGDTIHWVSFWFKNPTPAPVRFMIRERSCTSCTSARIAVVPDDLLREYADRVALSGLPWSPVPLPGLLPAAAYAGLDARLAWHVFDLDNKPREMFTIPPAAAGPTVGVLSLGFKAKSPGPPKPISVLAAAAGPDDRASPYQFDVVISPRAAFDVNPAELVVGDLPEGAGPRTVDAFVFSSIRLTGQLPPPVARVERDDPMVTIGRPVPMTAAEKDALIARAKAETKVNLRVEAGYRLPITVTRDLPGKLPDIGKFSKSVGITVPGTNHTAPVTIVGRVTGMVRLEDGEKIDLGSYNSDYPVNKAFRIFTNHKDLELTLDPDQSGPSFVRYVLELDEQTGERKYWTIKVSIPAKAGRRPTWEGDVVLRARKKEGGEGRVRLPVTGSGIGR